MGIQGGGVTRERGDSTVSIVTFQTAVSKSMLWEHSPSPQPVGRGRGREGGGEREGRERGGEGRGIKKHYK